MGVPDMRSTQFDIMKPLPPTLPSLSSNLSAPPKRKRSDSKGSIKPSKVVKKSSSTPNMAKSQDSGSGDEKKRNKLGYHRTSVACGMFQLINGFYIPWIIFSNKTQATAVEGKSAA